MCTRRPLLLPHLPPRPAGTWQVDKWVLVPFPLCSKPCQILLDMCTTLKAGPPLATDRPCALVLLFFSSDTRFSLLRRYGSKHTTQHS